MKRLVFRLGIGLSVLAIFPAAAMASPVARHSVVPRLHHHHRFLDIRAIKAGIARLQRKYDNTPKSSTRGLFCRPGGKDSQCWWQSANELITIMDYSQQTGNKWYLSDLANTYRYAAREQRHSTGAFLDPWFDDDGWWGVTWLDAYRLTGNKNYLHTAEHIFSYIRTKGWSGSCGGGVKELISSDYPRRKEADAKNTGTNVLYIILGARLYLATHNSRYLKGTRGALAAIDWLSDEKFIPRTGSHAYLVGDLVIRPDCTLVTHRYHTNWQGGTIDALLSLYQVTHKEHFLTTARNIAGAVLGDTSPWPLRPMIDQNGVLTEPCHGSPDHCDQSQSRPYLQFKGIFMRDLYCLNSVVRSSAYRSFIARNAAWILKTYGRGRYGFTWDHYSMAGVGAATEGSALDALIANMGGSYRMCKGWNH